MSSSAPETDSGLLFTDMYQFTMAQVYFRLGLHEQEALFEYFFRGYPNYGLHQAGYCVCAGLEWALNWMEKARLTGEGRRYLAAQKTRGGTPLFREDFLDWLERDGDFSGLILEAVPEGRVVHPGAPLIAASGPLAMAQILETALLNQVNYQTLVATKASRMLESARGGTILEFGLRRAQERGGHAGARAALIGGARFSSNVALSRRLDLPAKGTHGHSLVQLFLAMGLGELEAFRAYAEIYPDDCVFLVDTINTLESGVPNAIRVFQELRRRGHAPVGIRLDSGDLAHLSIQAARQLEDAGFPEAGIVLSNNLDELVIRQIVTQISEEAPRYGVDPDRLIRRLSYGVGTRLISSWGEPALGGVYKLVALRRPDGWAPAIKRSETQEKTTNPGRKKLWRLYDRRGKATADLISLADEDPRGEDPLILRHPSADGRSRSLAAAEISGFEELLEKAWAEGRPARPHPSLAEIRSRREKDVDRLDPGVRRLINPHIYHVSLTSGLWTLKQKLLDSCLPKNQT